MSFWVTIGAFIYPAPDSKTWPLPLSTEQCDLSNVTESVPLALSRRYGDLQDDVKSQREGNPVRGRCLLQRCLRSLILLSDENQSGGTSIEEGLQGSGFSK